MRVCKDCAFCQHVANPVRGQPEGFCHRYPPTPNAEGLGIWPAVYDSDGCAEFYPINPPSSMAREGNNNE